jgi:hypothetical protein
MGQHIILSVIHEISKLWSLWPERVSDLAPLFARGIHVFLSKGCSDIVGDHCFLSFADICQGIAHKVNATTLPGRR